MDAKVINIITNILGIVLAVAEPLRAYFLAQPFSWATFIPLLLTAVIAYFTGKSTLAAGK